MERDLFMVDEIKAKERKDKQIFVNGLTQWEFDLIKSSAELEGIAVNRFIVLACKQRKNLLLSEQKILDLKIRQEEARLKALENMNLTMPIDKVSDEVMVKILPELNESIRRFLLQRRIQ